MLPVLKQTNIKKKTIKCSLEHLTNVFTALHRPIIGKKRIYQIKHTCVIRSENSKTCY